MSLDHGHTGQPPKMYCVHRRIKLSTSINDRQLSTSINDRQALNLNQW